MVSLTPKSRAGIAAVFSLFVAAGCGLRGPFDPIMLVTVLPFIAAESVNEEAPKPPSGYYEVTDARDTEAKWSNPDSGIAMLIPSSDLPMTLDLVPAGMRSFVNFDAGGVIIAGSKYEVATNTILLNRVDGNPLLGARPTREEGGWHFARTVTSPPDSGFTIALVMNTSIEDAGENGARIATVTVAFEFTATQVIPADPSIGRPEISAGEKASWVITETATIFPSDSPFTLFPDAAVEVEPLSS